MAILCLFFVQLRIAKVKRGQRFQRFSTWDELPRQGCAEQYARPAADHASGWTDERRRRAVLGDKELKEVTLPSGLTAVSDGMFSGCTALQSIDLPDTVAYIGEAAFSGCTALTDLTFPAGLESFGQGLAGLRRPDGDHGPHRRARAAGGGIQRLQSARQRQPARGSDEHRPHRVPILHQPAGDLHSRQRTGHSQAFEWALRLSDIRVGAGNPTYHTVDGVLMTKDGYELTAYPGKDTGIRYDVPDGVVEIAPSAFFGSGLVAVRCPDSLRKIGRTADRQQ